MKEKKMIGILTTATGNVTIYNDEIGNALSSIQEENRILKNEILELKLNHFRELMKNKNCL